MESNNNSASLQSSSGGDNEYDSRAATSYSPFLNQPQQQFSQPYSNTQITPYSMFDPSPPGYNFANQNPLLNLDMLTWSKSFRSGDPPQAIINSNSQPQTIQPHRATGVRPSPSPEQGTSCRVGPGSGVGPVRNKKRSRASRRAPTTVLTTDTTNFRAMVQEFTGIPAPPFSTSSSSSLFPRTTTNRLDLFSNTPPNYGLLRPLVTKIQPPPTTHVSTANNNNNFQLPPPIVNSSQLNSNSNNNNNHNINPMLSFQSLLQTSSASPNYSSLPQFNHPLSGLEAGASSPTTMMMRRIRSNISYADPRQQQQQQQENADQEENVASRS